MSPFTSRIVFSFFSFFFLLFNLFMISSQPISFKTNIEELSELCSIVTCSLCRYLDIDRQKNLTVFCYKLLSCIDISPSVIYTGLKYIQSILANNYQCVDEYSLFTVTLLLAYKYTEDYSPPNMWSFVSMIPVKTLISLETKLLQHLDYSLHISAETFMLWTEECNVLCNLQQQQSLIDIYHNYYYDYSYYYYYYHYTLNTYPTLSSHLMYDEAYQDDVCSQTQIPVISSNDIWYPFFL
ncbi:hypothetical protein RMATCC62417_02542 [Rhizopus microsporus]|nr:hypothetical protein RMATCC62417_02542 [Rhizopus microsporus]